MALAERRLVEAALQGDERAADALARRHADAVWRAAIALTGCRESADEVFQESFLRAFRSLRKYDRRRPFGPWLHRIVVNSARDVVSQRRVHASLDASELEAVAPGLDPDEAMDIARALESLDFDRKVAVVTHLLGYTSREVAQITDVANGTARSRVARGLADLRARLRGSTA